MSAKLDQHLVAFIDILGFSEMVEHDGKVGPKDWKYLERLLDVFTKVLKPLGEEHGIHKMQFSDSIVLSTPFERDKIATTIGVIGQFQNALLAQGILIRGCLTFGRHFYEDAFVFSPALIEAYLVESREAIYPRVVLSKDLKQLLDDPKTKIENMLVDKDGMAFIDYLAPAPDSLVQVIANGLKSRRASVVSKYAWLADYAAFHGVAGIDFPTAKLQKYS